MRTAKRLLLLSVVAALPQGAVAAGKYTWFDGDPAAVDLSNSPTSFGLDVYSYTAPREESPKNIQPDPEHVVRLYGDYDADPVRDETTSRRFAKFGVNWQHRVSDRDRLSVSAQQGESSFLYPSEGTTTSTGTLDTRAAVSWTHDLSWDMQPRVTGGLFLGEESAREDASRGLGRRYFGFTVGGEMRLMQSHVPYVSFRMERSLYDLADVPANGTLLLPTVDDTSRLSAGWRWQVQRGWSLQAEASYGFDMDGNGDPLGLDQNQERGRVFFGTRFDFH
jgi:hypothetical protein